MRFMQRLASMWWLVCGVLASFGAYADFALAQQPAAQEAKAEVEDVAESRSAAFQAVEGPQAEQVPGGPLLVGAYGFILVLMVGYVARLGSLYAKNRVELERVAQAVERGRKD